MAPDMVGDDARAGEDASARAPARVAVHVVTWNRRAMADRCLEAIAGQSFGAATLDVVVIDNGSTDHTVEYLAEKWDAERVVPNPTERAHEPDFRPATVRDGARNRGGFRSLTIVANAHNHGGCGGFNTGFAFTDAFHDKGETDRPEFVWLVDDDAIPDERSLERMVRTARSHSSIGLVGARMVDMTDHERTLETTVYFTPSNGLLGPAPEPGHRMYEPHRQWTRDKHGRTHGTEGDFTGVRDVDVQAACSLLGRWDAAKKVGFWDARYFIYNDDADWCLRFAKAGYRVVIDLDAVVYHEPWHAKVTPARSYYGQRNIVWMDQKVLRGRELKRVTARRMGRLMIGAARAIAMRRLFHAELMRRTATDIMDNRGGKLDFTEPAKEPATEALQRAGALHAGATIALLCGEPYMLTHALNLRDAVRAELAERHQQGREPRWLFVVKNTIQPEGAFLGGDERSAALIYGGRRRSRWFKAPLAAATRSPAAAVVFDQNNDFPLWTGGWNLHMDTRNPGALQAEQGGWGRRISTAARLALTGARAAVFAMTIRPAEHRGRFNTGA